MLFYIILGIVFVIAVVVVFNENGLCWESFVASFGRAVVCTLLAFLFTGLGQLIATECAEIERVGEPTEMIEIAALTDNNFVRCTRGENSPEYHFMKVTEKGKMLDHIKSSHAYLTEVDGISPRIDVYDTQFVNPVVRFLFGSPTADEYQIFVPTDSITADFNVDLE